MMIQETISTPIADSCDVLVCGGGFAGIAAALAAARQKKKVILLEKEYLLGGLGTAGLVTIYLPLCDGMGHQVSFGIAEELLRLSISLGAEDRYPDNWLDSSDTTKRTEKDHRFQVQYNPNLFAILAEQLLLKEGVEILYGTYAVAVHKENEKIRAVITENKSGRQAIAVGSVVDATGDCDIAHFAGAPTELHQPGNVLAAWYYYLNEEKYALHMLGYAPVTGEVDPGKALVPQFFTGLDGKEISDFMQKSHACILNDVLAKRENAPATVPTFIATIPQLRMTRRIAGEYTMDITEEHKRFDDSVGMVGNWRKRGPVYEVPFRTLYSAKVKNLITAGRSVSTTNALWDIMRVIPCCAVTGEAAGIAAAMTDDFTALEVAELQKKLVEAGVVLHEADL